MSTPPLKRLLITGATGKQGGAVIKALLSIQARPNFHILALTRNANSTRARALEQNENVSIVEGDLDDCSAIFRKLPGPLHGVFSVQVPLKPTVEEAQGKALVDAAAAKGVSHFIYTSAERGGPERSDNDGTPIAHFKSKFNIENHLKAIAAGRGRKMDWTIIRPVAFMENLTPGFIGKAFASMWSLNGLDSKLQLVSALDIGVLAADAFKNQNVYAGRAISFATDELSIREAEAIFKRVVGIDMPRTYDFVGRMIRRTFYDQLGAMFDWFRSTGFGANPREYTAKFPEMQDFEKWLRESSGFKQQAQGRGL